MASAAPAQTRCGVTVCIPSGTGFTFGTLSLLSVSGLWSNMSSAGPDARRLFLSFGFHFAKTFDRFARPEILELKDLANLALALRAVAPRGVNLYESLGPLDRLVPRLYLDDRVAGDQLLRFREGPVDHRALAPGVADAKALRTRLEPLAREDHPGLGP